MKWKIVSTPKKLHQIEHGQFDTIDILLIVWTTLKRLRDKTSILLWSSFLLLLVWGFHGNMALIKAVCDPLFGPNWIHRLTFGLGWGETLLSFAFGFLLVVAIPCAIIRFRFKEPLRDYGLGWPSPKQRQKAWVAFWSLFLISSVLVVLASFDPGMQHEYPLFVQRNADGEIIFTITHWWEFVIYECIYLLFFITIEFAFRGYLLFGLYSIRYEQSAPRGQLPTLRFGLYAILIQMLVYTTWHYGKPIPEMVGTVIWGICASAIALRIRSLWPVIFAHWLYNVLLDLLIWTGWIQKLV